MRDSKIQSKLNKNKAVFFFFRIEVGKEGNSTLFGSAVSDIYMVVNTGYGLKNCDRTHLREYVEEKNVCEGEKTGWY